jgi:hypothetical protein
LLFTYDSNACNFWSNHFCPQLMNMAISCELITKPTRPLVLKLNHSCITFTIGILKMPLMIEITIMIVLINNLFFKPQGGFSALSTWKVDTLGHLPFYCCEFYFLLVYFDQECGIGLTTIFLKPIDDFLLNTWFVVNTKLLLDFFLFWDVYYD